MAGAYQRDAPRRAGLRHQPAVNRGQQAGAYERRLAAPRSADDGEKARATKTREQFVGLPLVPEENVVFLCLEGAQAGEGVACLFKLGHRPPPFPARNVTG